MATADSAASPGLSATAATSVRSGAIAPRSGAEDDRGLAREAGAIATAAAAMMAKEHEWYRSLSAQDRAWVGAVAQAGIDAFLGWFRQSSAAPPQVPTDIFGVAPAELAHTITLRQTLDLVRTTIEAVEEHIDRHAPAASRGAMHEAILRYSREVAFAAAQVYAAAAESRGAWDARLESLVVHAVIRGEADQTLQSRAAELGWAAVTSVAVVVGGTPAGSTARITERLRQTARRLGVEALSTAQGARLICVVGNVEEPLDVAAALAPHFADGPVVIGPRVPHLFAAGRSARAALSGLDVAAAWPGAPNPVAADELLAERALNGEAHARRILTDRVYRRLREAPADLLRTAQVYLDNGAALEASARALFVHANTVRYRLGRIDDVIGLDLSTPRDAWVARVAISLGLIGERNPSGWRIAMARPSDGTATDL